MGRVIKISPDPDAALRDFLAHKDLAGSAAFYEKNRELIIGVFHDTRTDNLRLLRQALLEFSRFHRSLPIFVSDNERGMCHLLATFMVLSIAYHSGTLSRSDFEQIAPDYLENRILMEIVNRGNEGDLDNLRSEAEDRIGDYLRTWSGHDHVMLGDAFVISPRLIVSLNLDGHASKDLIDEEFDDHFFFIDKDESEPNWQTLWWWPRRDAAQVEAALQKIDDQLEGLEFLAPLDVLHVAGVIVMLADDGIRGESVDAAKGEILEYIHNIEQKNLLTKDSDISRYGGLSGETGAYGLAFSRHETPEFAEIRDELERALKRQFWSGNEDRVRNLLKMCRDKPEDFASAIDNQGQSDHVPNYAHVPIFGSFDGKRPTGTACRTFP